MGGGRKDAVSGVAQRVTAGNERSVGRTGAVQPSDRNSRASAIRALRIIERALR